MSGPVIVAGTVRIAPGKAQAALPHMTRMVEASRAEDGCIAYSYGFDALDPTIVRVFEVWRDETCLKRHIEMPHLKAWRAAWGEIGLSDRDLTLYETKGSRKL